MLATIQNVLCPVSYLKCKAIILPVLYMCEIRFLTLKEEYSLRTFENGMMMKICTKVGGSNKVFEKIAK
jgi:hypothetical protein